MRVLYWTDRFWPHVGGIETVSAALLPALRQRGHDFHILTSHSATPLPDEDIFAGVPLQRLHLLTALTQNDLGLLATSLRRLHAIKQHVRPDLVHLHFSGPSALFHWKTAAAHPAPTLLTLHALHTLPEQADTQHSLLVRTLQQAAWVTSVSEHLLMAARRLVPEIAARSSVIYNGVAQPTEAPTPLPLDPPTLLCVGRLVIWKGFTDALRALAEVRHHWPRARLVIAGDGPQRAALEEMARELGVADGVTFLGWVEPPQIPSLLNRCTLLLIPSWEAENLPMTAMEAAWMQRPVIASHLSGLPEVVRDGETGALVPPHAPDALAARIVALLADPTRLQRMGEQARAHAAARFTIARCAAAYDALYRQLAGESAPVV